MPASGEYVAAMDVGAHASNREAVLSSMRVMLDKIEQTGDKVMVDKLSDVQNRFNADRLTFVESMEEAEKITGSRFLAAEFGLGYVAGQKGGGIYEGPGYFPWDDELSTGENIGITVMLLPFMPVAWAVNIAAVAVTAPYWIPKGVWNIYKKCRVSRPMRGGGSIKDVLADGEIEILKKAIAGFNGQVQKDLKTVEDNVTTKSRVVSMTQREFLANQKDLKFVKGDYYTSDGRMVIHGGASAKKAPVKKAAPAKKAAPVKKATSAKKPAAKKPAAKKPASKK